MSDAKPQEVNRRVSRRLPAKGKIKVVCYKGCLDLGANHALSVLDISETGLRLLVKTALNLGQEVLITLEGPGHPRPVKRIGRVIRSLTNDDGTFLVGIRLEKTLDYRDVANLT